MGSALTSANCTCENSIISSMFGMEDGKEKERKRCKVERNISVPPLIWYVIMHLLVYQAFTYTIHLLKEQRDCLGGIGIVWKVLG